MDRFTVNCTTSDTHANPPALMRIWIFIAVYALHLPFALLYGQNLRYHTSFDPIVLNKSGDTLNKAWIGGLNQPQFQSLDLNNDGKKDFLILDRSGSKLLPFIQNGSAALISCVYRPEYEQWLPEMNNTWFIIKDYDMDGKADLWTKSNNKVVLYKNITAAADLHVVFHKVSEALVAYNFMPAPLDSSIIAADNFNIPAIEDVDDDGDIDIFSYQANEGNLLLYRNMTADYKLPLHPPVFDIADFCWGNFRDTAYDGVKLASCPYKYYRKHSGGSTLLWFDNDHDGDMDVLMGNAGGTNLLFLKNGKAEYGSLHDSITAYEGHWPEQDTAVNVKSFPASFLLDADGDAVKDIVISPNQTDPVYPMNETHQVRLYKNYGTDTLPVFKLDDSDFFTRHLLDHGAYTDPVLYDIDNDKDLDLIMVTNGNHAETGNLNYRLILYRNTGTQTKAVFKLEDEDLWGLSNDSIQYLSIAIGDLNGDQKPDLIAGNYFGSLYFYKNIGTSTTWAFTTPVKNYGSIRVGERSTPQIVDVNKDGLADLLIGEKDGNLNYYMNTGTSGSAKFVLVSDTLGNVRLNEITGYSGDGKPNFASTGETSCKMADLDNNGTYELVCGGTEGRIRFFRFNQIDQVRYTEDTLMFSDSAGMRYSAYDFGAQSRPATGDLNGDGVLDLVVGNNRGGLHLLMGKAEKASTKTYHTPKPKIHPNPLKEGPLTLTGLYPGQYTFTIRSLGGQILRQVELSVQNQYISVNPGPLPPGMYLVQINGDDARQYFYKLMIADPD